MGDDENGEMGFPSSSMNTIPVFKSSIGGDPFFANGWDPLVSLGQGENYGGCSSMVSHNEFPNSNYHELMQNQGISSTSHLANYPSSNASFIHLGEKNSCYGNDGGCSEIIGSFGHTQNRPREDFEIPEEGISANGKRRRREINSQNPINPNMKSDGVQQMELSEGSTRILMDQDEKNQKIEKNTATNSRGKQTSKQTKESSLSGEAPKEDYIHMRARRGQATNSHSLAERVRREKISERMRMLQELVPGCNKITGKAVMLDEIINYVQSLQQQVEFLSMKLSTVNPELNIDLDRIISKDILHPRGGPTSIMNAPSPYPHHGIIPGNLLGIPHTAPQFHPMPQTLWDNEIQNLLQMGYDSNPVVDSLGLNGRSKPDI